MTANATITHMISYKTKSTDTILSQTLGYKERELDRSPPDGFVSARILVKSEQGLVVFITEWVSQAQFADTAEGAPWEAAMDLNETFSESVSAQTFNIVT